MNFLNRILKKCDILFFCVGVIICILSLVALFVVIDMGDEKIIDGDVGIVLGFLAVGVCLTIIGSIAYRLNTRRD